MAFTDLLTATCTRTRKTKTGRDAVGYPTFTTADVTGIACRVSHVPHLARGEITAGGVVTKQASGTGMNISIEDFLMLAPSATDITAADQVSNVVGAPDVSSATVFDVYFVRDAGGKGHHKEVYMRQVEASAD